jgi:hypothetical protein
VISVRGPTDTNLWPIAATLAETFITREAGKPLPPEQAKHFKAEF